VAGVLARPRPAVLPNAVATPLSWNEIRHRAITFSRNGSDASRERAEAQTFGNEFFDIFGIRRRTVASFEEPVRNRATENRRDDIPRYILVSDFARFALHDRFHAVGYTGCQRRC
jgi:hypothetical protein